MLTELPLAGAQLSWDPAWLPPAQADELFTSLRRDISWQVHRIRLFGRWHDSPRLSCWMGDAGASYRYSGVRFEPHPWPAAMADLRARLRDAIGLEFNSVLANLYRDGRDAMGWHADDEPELGTEPVIASLSLGQSRRFLLKHRREPTLKLALELGHGSLLVMRGDTHGNYRHALPRSRRPMAERINLTFRQVQPSVT